LSAERGGVFILIQTFIHLSFWWKPDDQNLQVLKAGHLLVDTTKVSWHLLPMFRPDIRKGPEREYRFHLEVSRTQGTRKTKMGEKSS